MRDKRARFKFRRFGVQIPGRTVVGRGFFQTFSSPSPVDSYTGSECCYSGRIQAFDFDLTVSHPGETSLNEESPSVIGPGLYGLNNGL
jgi:hypothetical protein